MTEIGLNPVPGNRYGEIDFIKGAAIVSVILLHSRTANDIMYNTLGPFHIWQAVPVFLLMAGFNSTLSSTGRGPFRLRNEYTTEKLVKYVRRLMVPFTIVWLLEVAVLTLQSGQVPAKFLKMYIVGGTGPGNYFTPLYIQHLLFFPFLLLAKKKLAPLGPYGMLAVFFALSMLLDYLALALGMPEWIYRLSYIRYVFAAVLGSLLVTERIRPAAGVCLVVFSVVYTYLSAYRGWTGGIIYPEWGHQHAPAYFYTAFLLVLAWKAYPRLKDVCRFFIPLGKASYHIFLVQMFYFAFFKQRVWDTFNGGVGYLALSLVLCLLAGHLFFEAQQAVERIAAEKIGAGSAQKPRSPRNDLSKRLK